MKKITNKHKNHKPVLRFSPRAWAKLLFMRDMTDNEVGGFGITEADDSLFVVDFAVVKQKVTCVSVAFDDNAVGDFFEDQVTAGRKPEQFARIWLHTHPCDSPSPSSTDESTFARVFGSCDWSVMAIVAQDNSTFARLRFNTGPGGEIKIPVCIDYSCEFDGSDFEKWQALYLANVIEENVFNFTKKAAESKKLKHEEPDIFGTTDFSNPEDMLEELEQMHPDERQIFMDELAIRSDFWDEEMEAFYE